MCPAVAYEMLVSHSPPVFSHSPPSSFLTDYAKFRSDSFTSPPTTTYFGRNRRNSPSPPPVASSKPHRQESKRMPLSPIRPCLVIRPEESNQATPTITTAQINEDDPTSPTKLKKKVVFADDKGMSLTHVRVMTEPSNVPPVWSFRYLAEVTQGMSAEPGPDIEPWELTFPQPASDYVEFRKKLENCKVSLENVIIKEADEIVIGTVKVSNLSFHKEVFIRLSVDNWKTFEDAFCKYVPNSMATAINSAYILFDTFSFKIPLPLKSRKIEFCVCFRCDATEYWDNNYNKNYVIIKKSLASQMHKSFSADDIYTGSNKQKENLVNLRLKPVQKCTDAVQAKLDSWSEFASWGHLENTTPYY